MSISILNIIMIFTEEFPRYLSFVLNLDDNQTSKSNISPHHIWPAHVTLKIITKRDKMLTILIEAFLAVSLNAIILSA